MDIKQLLNPPSRSAGQGGVTETPRSQNVDSTPAGSVDSSFRNRLKARPASSACSPVGQYSHAVNPNLNIETSARSSISSYSSMQSYPTIATSPSSTTTMNSNLSFSPGYIPGSNPYAPVFKVPNYSPTLTSPMSGPPTGEPLTPLGSDCSPSRVMSSYFPLQPPFQRRISGSAFENSDSLTALAALATEDSVVVRNEDDDVVDAAEVLTGRRSSRNSLTLGAPMAKKLRAFDTDGISKFRSMPNVAEHPIGDRGYKGIAPHAESPNYSPTATAFVTPSPERASNHRDTKYDNSPPGNRTICSPDGHDASPPLDHDDFQNGDNMPKCSYIPNCSTSSPLRKVVSHIFGRNKLSTRQIPPNIWVYYCRKHYQRSRYRNPKGFAKLQCELVRKQVERLINWGGVSDWVIKVRRREEMRLSREGLMSGQTSPEDDDECKGFPNKIAKQNRTNRKNWLVSMTGTGKTHHDIRALLAKIEEEVVHNGGTFPDVEILPNVLPSALDVLEEDQPRRRSDAPKVPNVREAPEKLRPVKPIVPKSKKRKRSDDSDDATEQPYAHGGVGFDISPVSMRPRGRSPSISTVHHADSAPRSVPEQSQQPLLGKKQSPLLSRNKRKASRSPSPAAEVKRDRMSHPEEQSIQHFGNTAARAKRPRTLKPMVRQQDAARSSELESVAERHYPHSAPLEASHESSFLPPPLMEDTLERQRRRSSTDTASLHSYMAMRGGMGSRLGSLSKSGMYNRAGRMQEHSPMFATPPPSASSFSGRSSAEPDDREFDATFKGFSFDRALGGDAPIDSSKHVRDYISGFSARRSTRMQEIEGFSARNQNTNNKAGAYQPYAYSLKRKFGAEEPEQQHYPPTSTPRHLAELPAEQMHRINHQNSHSRVHMDQPQSSLEPRTQVTSQSSSSRKRAVSLSPTKQAINPSMGSKRRRRASSVGPTRKKSSCASVAMKRTRTLPAKDFSSVHGMLDCIRVRN